MRIWILLLAVSISTNVAAQCDFVTANYIKEIINPSYVKSINVEVLKNKKFAKNSLRIFASKTKTIPPKFKKKFNALVKVEYSFGYCLYRAKIRQSGNAKDHIDLIGGKALQSLDVQLLDGNIVNATKFKLLISKTRNGKHEVLASLILRELDFISPETFEVNVDINGLKTVMIFQEKATKELLERRSRREGPIFKGDQQLLWSNKGYGDFELYPLALSRLVNDEWFNKGSTSQKITLESFRRLQKVYLDYKYKYHVLDEYVANISFPNYETNKIFSNYHIVLLAMNGQHAIAPAQRQYYFNSIQGTFEPIYYDGNVSFSSWSKNKYGLFHNPPSNDFINRALKLVASDSLRKSFLERTRLSFGREDFFFQSMEHFKKNLLGLNNSIKTTTENVSSSIKSSPNYSWYRKLQLEKNKKGLQSVEHLKKNLLGLNNSIKTTTENVSSSIKSSPNYSWYKKFQNKKKVDQNIITQVNIKKLKTHLLLDDGSSIEISTTDLSKILTRNSLDRKRFIIFPSTTTDVTKNDYKDIKVGTKIIRVSNNMDVKFDKSNKQIEFIQSHPKDWALLLGGDYSNWNLVFRGIKSYNTLANAEGQRFNALGLTGCLTLYKTKINNTQITASNGECEDSINFIRSFGERVIISVSDSFADAVDADFSQLIISNLEVVNAGNDCLDVSSGNYLLNNAKLSNCKDKGISVGEMSTFQGDNISIDKANIGVSSKDFSKTIINNLNLNEVVLCGESKRKKKEFGGARLSIIDNNCATLFEHDNESTISKENS